MKQLSIVVPVFESKKTLKRLLKSIVDADISDIASLVLVFDNDKNDYGDEISYISSRFDVETIFLDENLGPGLARQAGFDAGDSEFVMFADSDDYFYPKALKNVSRKLKNYNFDILVTAFRYERDGEVKIKKKDITWLHGKIYRRKFLADHNIRFNSFRSNEDNGFNRLALLYKPRLNFDETVTYVYSENGDSITRRNNREYKFTGLEFLSKNLVWAAKEYINNCKNCDFASVAELLLCLLLSMYYYYLEFYDIYNVEKILLWSNEGLEMYEEYENYLSDARKNKVLDAYDAAYPGIIKMISFDDFLQNVRGLR